MRILKRGAAIALSMVVTLTTVVPNSVLAAQQPKEAKAAEEPYVVSINRPVYASSEAQSASLAVDGDLGTRWESKTSEAKSWMYVDLGKATEITKVYLKWEAAAAENYEIQMSNDEINWKTAAKVTDGKASEEKTLTVSEKARYVRVLCNEKVSNYGYSLYEFQVYGVDGLVKPPVDYGENVAKGKKVTSSSVNLQWWMRKQVDTNTTKEQLKEIFDKAYFVDGKGNPLEFKDLFLAEDGFISYKNGDKTETALDQKAYLPENAVDGVKTGNAWQSQGSDANKRVDDQWFCVDLGQKTEIGRIMINWKNSARAYEIQVSDTKDGGWTTIYNNLNGHPTSENIPIYANARYVRIYGMASWGNDGIGISELEVYKYRTGEEKKTYNVESIPEVKTEKVKNSDASYATDDIRFPMAKPPVDLADNLKMPNKPVASNDWWQTMLITDLGEGLVVLPFRVKHSTKGLGIVEVNDCWYDAKDQREGALGSAVVNKETDFFLTPEGLGSGKVYDKVIDYSDYSVTAQVCDDNGPAMTNTYVKGSPYLFSEFGNNQDVQIYSTNITGIYDDNGEEILKTEGKETTLDHFGIEVTDSDNKAKTPTAKSYFAINLPENTTVMKVGNKIKIHFAKADGYVSVGAMTKRADLKTFYQHGYAFINKTSVDYKFNDKTSKVTTNFKVTTDVKRSGFSDQTIQCLFPHQYKKSSAKVSDTMKYVSSRGTMKAYVGNAFETSDTFYGMVPQFTTPQNSEYDNKEMTKYLKQVDKNTSPKENLPGGDAYWQGKSLHPLALATLAADQSGNIEYRDKFLEKLRYIFEDWFTYSGKDDDVYLYYDKNWGTMYYRFSEFGANTGICDHHFTYGYFLFAASVLASYDDSFYEQYKEMLDLMARDYASPDREDDMFCRFRSLDLYEGHSWAGGYADNDDGNNQEAGGESLFGWVGMYLWATKSQNKELRDASIFGFTTEMNAVEQYWFNYDGDNWPKDYPHGIVGQNYGATIFFGTFFDGNVTSIYGIHWLPVAEWITQYSMGENKDKLKKMYDKLLSEIDSQKVIEGENGGNPANVKTTLTGWQHIFAPLRSQFDPDGALKDYNDVVDGKINGSDGNPVTFDSNEQFNAYWFIHNMKDIGTRTNKIYALDGASASVYTKDEKNYTAIAWNPTDKDITVRFTDGTKEVGKAVVAAQSLVRLNPKKDSTQVSTPEFSLGTDTYEDTQYLKISSATEGAKIHYTTDGSNPTAQSPVYEGRLPISSTTTVKAIALKEDYIDSKMEAVTLTIQSPSVTTGKNIALGKPTDASSGKDSVKYIVDGEAKTRWETQMTGGEFKADDWCSVDLEKNYTINKVKINWESAYASEYKIQVSDDGKEWKDVYTEKNGNAGIKEAVFAPVSARYVRMQGVKRGSDYGYSIYELGIYEARQASKPQFSLKSGTYNGNQNLSIGSGTQSVEIRYTTDGTEPNEKSPLYIPQLILWKDTTIKAKAFKLGMIPSETAEADYVIKNGTKPNDQEDNYNDEDTFKPTPDDDIDEDPIAGESGTVVEDKLLKTCLSYKKDVTVSSSENENSSQNINDGNVDTGWSSKWDFKEAGQTEPETDEQKAKRYNQWLQIDLGSSEEFNEVKIKWITKNNQYKIQVSENGQDWTDVCTHKNETTEDGIDINSFDKVKARYVKLQGIKVGDAYGYSLAEMMVYLSKEEQPLGQNVAYESSIEVSSNKDKVSAINDGKNDTVWTATDTAPTATLDMYKSYKINKVIVPAGQDYAGKVTIEVSKDKKNWTKAIDAKDAKQSGIYKFDEQEARYVKVTFSTNNNLAVDEFKVYTTGSADVADEKVTMYDGTDAKASTKTDDAKNVIDNNQGTGWQAEASDKNAWCAINLGQSKDVNVVSIDWEAACPETYDIYVTDNIENWEPKETELAYQGENGKVGNVKTVLPEVKKGQYVVVRQSKVSGLSDAYGCRIFEFHAGYRDAIPVESVVAGPKETTLKAGQTMNMSYVVSPANADNKEVAFESSNKEVATVNASGQIKAKAAGTTVITVTSKSDTAKKATIKVNVNGPIKKPKITAKKTADQEITLTWTKADMAAGYNIYRSKTQNGKYTLLNSEQLIEETTYVDANLAKGTYYYTVEAIAKENDPIYENSEQSVHSTGIKIVPPVVEKTPLNAPEAVAVKEGTKAIKISWDKVDNATSYELYRSKDGAEKEKIQDLTETSYVDDDLEAGSYSYYVVAVPEEDSEYLASESSQGTQAVEIALPVVEKTPLNAPKATAVKEGTKAIKISWDKVDNAVSYELYRSKNGAEKEKIQNLTETSYVDANLETGSYSYCVVAVPEKGSEYLTSDFSTLTTGVVIEGSKETIVLNVEKSIIFVNEQTRCTVYGESNPKYSTSNKNVADVSETGVITGKSAGTATITAYSEKLGTKATFVVTVIAPTVKWNFSGKKMYLQLKNKKKANKTKAIQATGLKSGDAVKNIQSSKTKIATVKLSKGKLTITPKRTGSTKITVTTRYGATQSFTLKVQKGKVKVKKITVNNVRKNKLTLKRGKKYTLQTTKVYITALDKVKFSSSNKKIATVTSKGKITAKKKGSVKITVRCGKKKTTVKLTVK